MPSLRERLAGWIAGRAASPSIPFNPLTANEFGPGIGAQPDHATLLRESIGTPAKATRAIANRVATLEPQVITTRRVSAGTEEDEILDDHPLKTLIDKPHPNFTTSNLLRLAASHIITVGEAYWLKVGSPLGIPVELHPIPPSQIWPLVTAGVVTGYRVRTGQGSLETLRPDVVIRAFFPDPANPWGSEGYLGPAGIEADAAKFAGQHIRGKYESDGTPPTVLESGPEAQAFTPEEKERFETEWTQKYHQRMGRNRGGKAPAITPTGYKLVQIAMQTGAAVTPLLDFLRDDLLMNFFTPRSVLGQVVSGDRSSAETNQWVFDLMAVSPVAELISDAWTAQLAPDFDPSLSVRFAPFVSANEDLRLREEAQDLTGKVRSPNEIRVSRGLDESSWGELPVGQVGQIPYDGEEFDFGFGEPEDPEALGGDPEPAEGADDEDRARAARAVEYFEPAAEWARQLARERKFMRDWVRLLRIVLQAQLEDVLARLEASDVADVRFARVSADELFDRQKWERIFLRRVEPLRESLFREVVADVLEGLTGSGAFSFSTEMQTILGRQGIELAREVNATTVEGIRRALLEGTSAGESVDQIATRIRHVFAVRKKHARTIARTEILKASQEAQVVGYETSGVVDAKRWNTSEDEKVRDSHEIDGQTRGLREPFTLADGELADAPGIGAGGSRLSAHNAINCRCFLTPAFVSSENVEN